MAGNSSNPDDPIEVRAGDQFVLALDANRMTGYQWQLAGPLDAGVVRLIDSRYEAGGSGRPGAGGQERWTFQAVGAGTTTIVLNYARPFEHDAAPARSLTFKVVAQPGRLK